MQQVLDKHPLGTMYLIGGLGWNCLRTIVTLVTADTRNNIMLPESLLEARLLESNRELCVPEGVPKTMVGTAHPPSSAGHEAGSPAEWPLAVQVTRGKCTRGRQRRGLGVQHAHAQHTCVSPQENDMPSTVGTRSSGMDGCIPECSQVTGSAQVPAAPPVSTLGRASEAGGPWAQLNHVRVAGFP